MVVRSPKSEQLNRRGRLLGLSGENPNSPADFTSQVLLVIAAIPPGEVLSYGQVAMLAGRSGAGRAVGRILARSHGLPWWRVVTAGGRLVPGMEIDQARRLVEEGIPALPASGPQPQVRPRWSGESARARD